MMNENKIKELLEKAPYINGGTFGENHTEKVVEEIARHLTKALTDEIEKE